jgi:choline dehydrogenase-like flavoprotein
MADQQGDVYDFVIVGGGTAGLVIAARLTENSDITVAVIEAGEDQSEDLRVKTPGMWPAFQDGTMGWSFKTVPQVSSFLGCEI